MGYGQPQGISAIGMRNLLGSDLESFIDNDPYQGGGSGPRSDVITLDAPQSAVPSDLPAYARSGAEALARAWFEKHKQAVVNAAIRKGAIQVQAEDLGLSGYDEDAIEPSLLKA